jgi:hypothetical protein
MEKPGQINMEVDFGSGRQANVEFGARNQLWAAVGPGVTITDVWLKSAGHLIDLRVRVRRTESGVEVAIDRGDDEHRWWTPDTVPRLAVTIEPSAATATATASAGNAADFQQVILGTVPI